MSEYRLKIVGVHYAANPEYVPGIECTEEMELNTVERLKRMDETRPRVVLMPEPNNPVDPNAVMARAVGRKIGYVAKTDLVLAHRLLRCSGQRMMCAAMAEVEVCRRGSMYVSVEAEPEAVARTEVALPAFDRSRWTCTIASLDPHDKWLACQEAEYMLAHLLAHPTPETRGELMEYMRVWIDNNLHDLSRDTKLLREQYMAQLTALGDDKLTPLIRRIDKQRTALCGDHRMTYRLAWWRELAASPQMELYWTRWTSRRGCDLWRDLRDIDRHLRMLPGDVYDYVDRRSYLFARLCALDIPRDILWNIYTLLLLRERICTELRISRKPLAPDAYLVDEEVASPQPSPEGEGAADIAESEVPKHTPEAIADALSRVFDPQSMKSADWIAAYRVLVDKCDAPRAYVDFAAFINALEVDGLPVCSSELLRKADPCYKRPLVLWRSKADASSRRSLLDKRLAIAEELAKLL